MAVLTTTISSMDNISYFQWQQPAHGPVRSRQHRQATDHNTTKALALPQYPPTDVAHTPDMGDAAWSSGSQHPFMDGQPMLQHYTSVEVSLQDYMDLSPGAPLMDGSSLTPIQEEELLESIPSNDPNEMGGHFSSWDSQSDTPKPRGAKRSVQAIERRRYQNRRAQQAFRARREERLEKLRVETIDMKRGHAEVLREREDLHKQLAKLKEENALLRKCIESNVMGSTSNDFTFALPWQEPGELE